MIRWGIIGCGSVTEVKSGPALQRAEGSALVAVMRRDGEKARDYAERHGVAKWGTDARALIHDPEVDAVYIATPPAFHADYAVQVAQAGKPVYVEKPMGCTVADCRRMLAACRQAGVPLFVAYYRRALPRFLQVKALLDAGAIGAVRGVIVRMIRPAKAEDADAGNWRVDPTLAGGGYFFDLGSHMLDLLDFLLGPIAAVQGTAVNQAGFTPRRISSPAISLSPPACRASACGVSPRTIAAFSTRWRSPARADASATPPSATCPSCWKPRRASPLSTFPIPRISSNPSSRPSSMNCTARPLPEPRRKRTAHELGDRGDGEGVLYRIIPAHGSYSCSCSQTEIQRQRNSRDGRNVIFEALAIFRI